MSEGSPTEEFGPYLVYEQLGVGGMAQVHRAISANPDIPPQVALKRMLGHLTSNEEMVRSFVREARLASYLRHKNVAQTYDLGRVGDVYFIAMELIAGRNLREVLRHCAATTGPMPVPFALNILNQICDALDYAHNLCDENGQPLGIIHRDVSPSNVIVSDAGEVKLIDFGIAKASGAGLQTMSGTLKGKFAYMAPEYIGGQLDARADLFAVGVIAHELLTNRPLFSGRDDIDTLTRVREMKVATPSKTNPQVPPEIDDIVMTALARDPERRWQHATALRCALTTLTERLGLIATNAEVIQWLDWAFRQPRKSRRPVEPDTETDAPAVAADEPSISIIEHTAAPREDRSQKITLLRGDAVPVLPHKAPTGTPAYVPAQRDRAPTADISPPSERSGRHPRIVMRPGEAGASSARTTGRSHAPSAPPPISPAAPLPAAPRVAAGSIAAPVRTASASSVVPVQPRPPTSPTDPMGPPRMPAATAPAPIREPAPHGPSGSTLHGAPAPARPAGRPSGTLHASPAPVTPSGPSAGVPTPIAAMRSAAVHEVVLPVAPRDPTPPRAVVAASSRPPVPAVPSFNAAPFAAPRPSTPSQPPPYDLARSAIVQREFEQRTQASAATPAIAGPSRAVVVVLLLALAAGAALLVYFVVPLLT